MVTPSPHRGRQRRRWPYIAAACLLVGTLAALAAFPAATIGALTRATVNEKVRICHSTSSESNPYVSNEPAIGNNGDLEGGHHNDPDDIIPPYEYRDRDGNVHQFLGRNWEPPENQAIWQNGCKPLRPEPVKPTITVVKRLVPSSDRGKFALKIDGKVIEGASAVGNGGTTDAVAVDAGSHTVSESGAEGTQLGDYTISITCTGGASDVSAAGDSISVTVRRGDSAVCTITNEIKEKPNPEAVVPVLECVLFSDGQPDVAYWGYNNTSGHAVTDPRWRGQRVHAGSAGKRAAEDVPEGPSCRRLPDAVRRLARRPSSGRCPGAQRRLPQARRLAIRRSN